MKKLIFLSTLAVLIAAFTFLPSLEGINTKNPIENRDDLEKMIRQMRVEIAANGGTYTVGINPAMQYSLDQLCSIDPSIPRHEAIDLGNAEERRSGEGIIPPPPTLPYSYIGYYTPVKDQGGCSSCWAFATCAQFESAIKRKLGQTIDLSEQYLINCNPYGYSCSGGLICHQMHEDYGAWVEFCIPYTGYNGSCDLGSGLSMQEFSGIKEIVPTCDAPCCYIQDWHYVYNSSSVPSTTSIKQAIYDHGAVSASVYASTYFHAYTGGTFNTCHDYSTNHGIQLVGWDNARGAWRLKNSWGTGWGESGFMWIKYGCCRVGYAASYVDY